MRFSPQRFYAKAALITQRVGLSRASWFCAARAGFFDKPMCRAEEPLLLLRPIYHRLYVYGFYGGVPMRLARRLVAGSEFHRAWLAGHMGIYEQDGVRCGVADRSYHQYRK